MTSEELAAIRSRVEKVTAGPWEWLGGPGRRAVDPLTFEAAKIVGHEARCADRRGDPPCNCGVDEHDRKIDAALRPESQEGNGPPSTSTA